MRQRYRQFPANQHISEAGNAAALTLRPLQHADRLVRHPVIAAVQKRVPRTLRQVVGSVAIAIAHPRPQPSHSAVAHSTARQSPAYGDRSAHLWSHTPTDHRAPSPGGCRGRTLAPHHRCAGQVRLNQHIIRLRNIGHLVGHTQLRRSWLLLFLRLAWCRAVFVDRILS